MSDIGKIIKPLTVKLEELAKDSDTIAKAVDPEQVKSIVRDFAGLSAKLNAEADKVDTVLTNLNGLLATGDSKGMFGEIAEAAKSFRKLADNLDARTKEIATNVSHFTAPASSNTRLWRSMGARPWKRSTRRSGRSRTIRPNSFLARKGRLFLNIAARVNHDERAAAGVSSNTAGCAKNLRLQT